MKPSVNLPILEEESSTLSMPSSLSSSSILDSPHSFIDSNFTLSKSFDPFDYTYLNNLIPTTTTTATMGKSTFNSTCDSLPPPSLLTSQNGGLSYSTINRDSGDMYDQDDEDNYADIDDYYPPHFLIDLDLLDDNATDSTLGLHSELESPLPTCPANKCRVGAPSPSSPSSPVGAGPDPGSVPGATGIMNHHLLHLPYLFISTSSSTSSSSSSSVTASVNIWSNNYYRYHDPFDDDEFDPTQPASLTLSPDTSLPFPYVSTTTLTTYQPPSPTIGTAIDMLMDFFPHYTQQQLVLMLSKANYDMDRFLELVSSGDGGAMSSVSYSKKRQVCRHFLSGDCHRQDCRFAHDISIKVCKFWLQGGCLKGPQCEFAHSLEPICVRSQNDPTTTPTTRSPKSNTKSSLSKNKNKSPNPPSKSSTDVPHQQYLALDSNIFLDNSRQRRRGRKKIKRKSNTHVNNENVTTTTIATTATTATTLITTKNNNEKRHAPSFVDDPLDEDFPTLLSSSKSVAGLSSTTTTGVHPLRIPTLSSTNFAQVVASSKMKK